MVSQLCRDVCGLSCSFHALLQLLASTSHLSLGSVLGRRVLVARGMRQSAVGLHTGQEAIPIPPSSSNPLSLGHGSSRQGLEWE